MALIIGFVLSVAAIVALVAIGDAGASNLENFFFSNSGISSGG